VIGMYKHNCKLCNLPQYTTLKQYTKGNVVYINPSCPYILIKSNSNLFTCICYMYMYIHRYWIRYKPSQMNPVTSSLLPIGHWHKNDPIVLLHTAGDMHLLRVSLSHSSVSTKI